MYFDTCVISGLAKGDLPDEEQSAVTELVNRIDSSDLTAFTSTEAKGEIEQIPEEYRDPHMQEYEKLSVLSNSSRWISEDQPFTEDGKKKYDSLTEFLPDEVDARHIAHAAQNDVRDFVTTDEKTIIRYRDRIQDASEVSVWLPSEYASRQSGDS